MRALFDLLPIVAFFVVFQFFGLYAATGVVIVATGVQVVRGYRQTRRADPFHMLLLVLVTALGGATLVLHEEVPIKWVPTLLYWALGASLLLSLRASGRPLLVRMIGQTLGLSASIWRRATLLWGVFLGVLGVANVIALRALATPDWVSFKLFGLSGALLVFAALQAIYLARHLPEAEPPRRRLGGPHGAL